MWPCYYMVASKEPDGTVKLDLENQQHKVSKAWILLSRSYNLWLSLAWLAVGGWLAGGQQVANGLRPSLKPA